MEGWLDEEGERRGVWGLWEELGPAKGPWGGIEGDRGWEKRGGTAKWRWESLYLRQLRG